MGRNFKLCEKMSTDPSTTDTRKKPSGSFSTLGNVPNYNEYLYDPIVCVVSGYDGSTPLSSPLYTPVYTTRMHSPIYSPLLSPNGYNSPQSIATDLLAMPLSSLLVQEKIIELIFDQAGPRAVQNKLET